VLTFQINERDHSGRFRRTGGLAPLSFGKRR
jgi:hypothetical protein